MEITSIRRPLSLLLCFSLSASAIRANSVMTSEFKPGEHYAALTPALAQKN